MCPFSVSMKKLPLRRPLCGLWFFRSSLIGLLSLQGWTLAPVLGADASPSASSPRPWVVIDVTAPQAPKDLSSAVAAHGFVLGASAAQPADKATSTPTVTTAALDPVGVWTWTTRNRNGQPIENSLRVSSDSLRGLQGTLFDGTGTYPISGPVLSEGLLSFTVLHEAPGRPSTSVKYTLSLGSSDPSVTVDRPDPTPEGRAKGLRRQMIVPASRQAK